MRGSGDLRKRLAALLIAAVCIGALVPAGSDVAVAATRSKIDKELSAQMSHVGAAGKVEAFVHFGAAVPYAEGRGISIGAGLHVVSDLPAANALAAWGPSSAFEAVAKEAAITRLEFPGRLQYHLETAEHASRVKELRDQTGGLDLRVPGPGGATIDGTGVGIAIVDSGIFALHPDLDWCGDGPAATCKTVLNFKVRCSVPQTNPCLGPVVMEDVADSDTTAGHGTHVSGIAAGTGKQSKGLFQGVAPGARLYGFGSGDGDSIFFDNAAASYQWIIDHHADPLGNGSAADPTRGPDPAIKVINNSWGSPGHFDPTDIISKLARAAIASGITVVWSAGNDGGNGDGTSLCTGETPASPPCTNTYGVDPTPGNIMVANYDDANSGTREGLLDTSSSRGDIADKSSWPDVSAPGSDITSTCQPATAFCPTGPGTAYPPYYARFYGTSMASPHVAGIVALLLQADPTLTPPQIENLLEDTAHKFTAGGSYTSDPANPGSTSSFDKGHGLVDARSAVLRRLGIPDDFGTETSSKSIKILQPKESAAIGSSFDVSGFANSRVGGGPAGSGPVVADETGTNDVPQGALDLERLTVTEPKNGKVEIKFKVRDETDNAPNLQYFRFTASFEGNRPPLNLSWDPLTGDVACDSFNGDPPIPASCSANHPALNEFVISADLAELLPAGTAVRGAEIFDIFGSIWSGAGVVTTIDQLPGGAGPDGTSAPERAKSLVLTGSQPDGVDIAGTVSVAVDGGVPQNVTTHGGTFSWAKSVGPLTEGPHTVRADLSVGGGVVATDTVHVNVPSPSVTVTSPPPGGIVPAGPLVARGSSSSIFPVTGVTVRALGNGGFDSGDITATDTGENYATWTAPLDLTTAREQSVTITATLHATGTPTTPTSSVTVTTSCSPTGAFDDHLEPTPLAGWTFDPARQDDPASPTWAHATDSDAKSPTHSFFDDADSGEPPATSGIKDDRLVAPVQHVSSLSRLEFWQRYSFEDGFDGGVLEVSTNGGTTWQDLEAAGGSFIQGGYTGTIDPTPDNSPINGRMAWTGASDASMTKVVADLGHFGGSNLLVRFRETNDSLNAGEFGTGWWIDDISFTDLLAPTDCDHAPIAVDDVASLKHNRSIDINVLANDTDADHDTLTVDSVQSPSVQGATVSKNANGTVKYQAGNTAVADSFTYTVSDGRGSTDVGSVAVTVTNAVPVATTDNVTVRIGDTIRIPVLANDTDGDDDTLAVTAVQSPSTGGRTVTKNADNTVSYPAPGTTGNDDFTYTISDGHGGTAIGLVNLTIVPNQAPVTVDDHGTVAQGESVTINVLANDTDGDHDALTVSGITQPAADHGSVTNNDDGTVTYTATPTILGEVPFTYTVSDGHGGSTIGNVIVHVSEKTSSCALVVRGNFHLERDLRNCVGDGLIVDRSDTTVNLEGHTISGTGANGSVGIRVLNADHVSIVGGTIEGFEKGMLLGNIRGAKIDGVHSHDNNGPGVVVLKSVEVKITNNDFSNNGGAGLDLLSGLQELISKNTASHNASDGIHIGSPVKGVRLTNNTASSNGSDGLDVDASSKAYKVRIAKNTLTNNAAFGLVAHVGSYYTAKDNTATGNNGGGTQCHPSGSCV